MRCALQISLIYSLIIPIRLFSEQNFDFEVPEDAPEGTLIGKITLESNLTYRLNGHHQFVSVDIKTGEVHISAPLNREAISPNGTIILILTAEPTTIIAVRINVLDINDNSPMFPSKYVNVSIVESAVIGSRIRLQPANDPDLAENGTIINYVLKDGEEFFTLVRSSNSTGGDILLLELLAKLDRETKDLFILNISAFDGGNPSRSGYCIVYVNVLDTNDNPPKFHQPRYDVQLNGSILPDVTILQVEATDADVGHNGRISYNLTTNPSQYFQIDHRTGVITVQYSALNCSEDGCLPDCSGMCVLMVEAEDQGEPKLIGRTLVYIHLTDTNLHDPEINFRIYPTGSEFASISSETTIGSTVAVITANDRDYGQNVQISIINGNDENYFRLESGKNYAILRQNRLVDKPVEQFLLKFCAVDDGVPPRSLERDLKVYVRKLNDTAPVLEEKFIKVSIFENSPVGSFVAAVRASSAGEDLHFSIIEDGKNDELFLVGKNTGIVTLSKTWPNHTKWNYEFEIIVRKTVPSDKFSICTIEVTIIDVNDHKPQFTSSFYEIEVSEDTPPLTVIFKIFATDEDHGINNVISYSMEDSKIFMVRESSGEILLRSKLDRETKNEHKITVTATDHGNPPRSSSIFLIINVLDVNDNDPYFAQLEYHSYIVRGDPSGTHLIQLKAFDDDSPKFAQISYLFYYSVPNFLALDHETGKIHLATHADSLSFERKLEVIVGAKDNGGRLSRNNATVHIWLLDSMLQVPKFSKTNNWSIEISENSSPEKILALFSVYPSLKNVRYRINTTDLLINELTGEVRARRSFDREVEPKIGFTVYADGEWSTGMHEGTLSILDQNDNSPIFELNGTAQFVVDSRWIGIGAELFRLRCYDADDGHNGHITYTVNSSFFGIDSNTGIVQLMKFPNDLNQMQFHVTATDGGEQSRHSTIKVVVEIKEDETIYSFPPVITLSIPENIPLGTIITGLSPKNITQRFEFQTFGVTENLPIQILPSGEVFVASKIDHEIMNYLSISVAAFNLDKNSIPNKHEFLLQLYVEDSNDNLPQCPENNKFIILENNIPGAVVGLFNGIDNDSGPNGTLFYELTNDSKEIFSIDPHTGIIRALLVLDFELAQFHNLTVTVTDGGSVKTKCAVMIEVGDSNDNTPHWEQEFYHFFISPSANGSFVGKVLARDLDSTLNGEVRYKLQQRWAPFKINENTGNITRINPLIPNHIYNITVIAIDKGIPPLSSAVFVFIHSDKEKNCTPNFTNYPNTDIEIDDSLLGQIITQIHAVACEAEILYSLSYGNSINHTHSNLELFWIDSIDGSIFLTKRLNAYVGERIELIIKAETISSFSSITFGVMVVNKRNGSSDKNTITVHVKENNNVDEICGKIETSGKDFQLLRQIPPGKAFRLQEQNLICVEVLDREQVNFYRLVVAEGYGLKRRVISIQVDDENDNSPECLGTKAILVGSESSFVPWNCSDKDADLNGTIGYKVMRSEEIISGMNDNGFIVRPFTGDPKYFSVLVYDRNTNNGFEDDKLRRVTELHYILISNNPRLEAPIEFKKQYRLNQNIQPGTMFGAVIAKTGAAVEYFTTSFKNEKHMNSMQWADIDPQTGQLRTNREPVGHLVNMGITLLSERFTKTITIELLVIGEERSIDKFHSYYEFTIKEGMPVGFIVGRLGNNETFKFELLKENDNFEIDEKNGIIRIKNEVQTSETYLDIRITNRDYNEISKSVTVLIIVAQAHNSEQFCLRNHIDLTVLENSPYGTFVGILTTGHNNLTRYILQGQPEAVSIDSDSGIITTTAPFDFEKENLYQFKAIAHGIAGISMECYTFLHIVDKNDNAPKFASNSYEVEVYEDAPVGQFILQLDVDDLDTVNEFVYEISVIGNERNWFGIKPDGRIFLTAPLDREHIAVHQLHVTVHDQRPPERAFKATTIVKVIVLDVNDNAPRFVSPSVFFIFDGTTSGTIAGLIHAVDPDLAHNGQLQYRILPWSNPEGLFIINPVFGYLLVREQIDVEEQKDYHLLVEAKDYGISRRLSTIVSITVTVLARNKESLRPRNFYYAKMPENVPVGHIVSQIITNTTRNVLFEIESGNEDNHFRISPINGIITTNERLNAAKKSIYNFTVSMRSGDNTKKQNSIILIEILNIDVKTIRFPGHVDRILYVGENMQGSYPITIGTLGSTSGGDSGWNESLSYSLIQGNSTLFRIVPQTSKLQITEPLNYEIQDRYELVVQADDLTVPRRFRTTSTVTVVVLNVNDNAPVFEQPQYYTEVMENVPVKENLALLCIKATDEDDREFSMIRYKLYNEDLLPFFINSTTGCIERLEVLDRESQSQWILEVIAYDNGKFVEHSSTAVVRIRVVDQNDNVPIILNEQLDVFVPNNVKEDDVLYILSAYDPDENDMLHYNLTGPDVSYFQINGSGVITATRQLLKRDYSVTAVVSDHGNLNSSVGLAFYVTDAIRFPIFEKHSQREFLVTEHEPDMLITKFIAHSANVSNRGILYSIFSGDPYHHFYLNPNSGELYTTSRVDFEYRKQYELWIAAIDQHTQPMISYISSVVNVVDINDNKPFFEKAFYSASVVENGNSDELVVKITARDSDSGINGKISYSLIADDSDGWKYFKINEESGEIFTISGLDAEHLKEYRLHIIAKDHGNPQLSEIVAVKIEILDKNDNAPRFSNLFHGTIAENSPLGTLILQVTSYDADVNSTLIYGLESNDTDSFLIDQQTGWISLAKEVDREKRKEYSIKVKAWDGLWEVRTSLTITIQDVNDNAPTFSHSFYKFLVTINSKIFTEIGQILAFDADEGLNGQVGYDLRCSNDLFMVESSSGRIFSITDLEQYVNNTVECKGFAKDQGFPPMISDVPVYIHITDSAESNETKQSYYEFALLPDADPGTAIGHLLLHGAIAVVNDSRFTIDKNGNLFTSATFSDAILGDKIIFSVATNNENDPMKITVSIEFTEPNIYPPQFSLKRYKFSVRENCHLHTSVGTVVAKDSDVGLNGHVTYHIIHGTDRLPFTIESTTGIILTAGQVDFEEISSYHFLIAATDSGFSALNDTAEVIVEVLDENDNVPEFENRYLQYTISTNSPIGTTIAHLSAVNVDSEPNAHVVYHLLSDSAGELPFAINATFGTLYVSAEFHYETANEYLFRVLASNPEMVNSEYSGVTPGNSRNRTYSDVVQVEIFVKPDGKSELYFPETERNFEISASALKGTIIGRVEAVCLSGNYCNKILYRTASNDLVGINHHTGELYVKETWNGTTGTVVMLIAATDQLLRKADFKPNICKVYIERINMEALPILQSHYKFSLSGDADSSKSFIILESLPRKCRLDFVEEGIGYDTEQPFCFDGSGKLHLCGPVDYKQKTDYHLQIALIENNIIRSRALITITVNNMNDKGLSLDPKASVGYILENSPIHTTIMELHIMANGISGKQASFKYQIADSDLSEIFAINDTTGVLSSCEILDREKRSLYIVPITVNDLDIHQRHATIHLRIYVDDQDDNEPEPGPRTIYLGYLNEIPNMIIFHTFPIDADQVSVYNCRLSSASQSYNISTNCMLELSRSLLEEDDFLDAPLLVEASDRRHSNITFPINLRVRRDISSASLIDDFGVIVELWGIEGSIADSISAFGEAFPDMVLQFLGLQHLEVDFFRVFVAVSDQHLVPTNKDSALKLLEQFFAEKLISKNVNVKQLATDMCTLISQQCMYGTKCSQNITKNGELLELIGYKTSFIVPLVISRVNCLCENDVPCIDDENQACDENEKCQNGGTCQPHVGTCLCPVGYSGKFCENDIDECEKKNICGNRKCLNVFGSFVCACGDNDAKNSVHCNNSDSSICDNCHRGTCIKQNNGQHLCECADGYSGRYCQLKIRCFDGFSSSLQFPFYQQISMLTQGFRILNPSGVLLSSFPINGSNGPHFILALQNGQVHLSVNSDHNKKNELFMEEKVNDGKWKMIRFRYNKHRRVKLTVEHCDDNGFCEPCKSTNCIATANNFDISAIAGRQVVYIGGMKNSINSDIITKESGIVNFEGCMRQIIINEHEIDKVPGFLEQNLIDKDDWKTCADDNDVDDICSGGVCVVDENDRKCICTDGFDALNCRKAMEPWHVKNGGIVFQLSMYIMEKIKFSKHNTSTQISSQKLTHNVIDDEMGQLREIPCEESEIEDDDMWDDIPAQWMELDFKTALKNTVIFAITEETRSSKIELINGSAHMITKMKGAQPMEVYIASDLDDTEWHRLSMQISEDQKLFRVEIDGHGKEIRSEEQLPTLISNSLLSLSLGHGIIDHATSFSGCFRRFLVNNQAQNFDALEGNLLSQQIFKSVRQKGARKGCDQFLMKRASISLEWKLFWALIGIICILFCISMFAVVLWIVRRRLFTDDVMGKRRKCWKPKLSRLLSVIRSDPKATHIDDNSGMSGMIIQRSMYCGPNILQNNESEVYFNDSYDLFQSRNAWNDDTHDLNASTLHGISSRDSITYQNLKPLLNPDKCNPVKTIASDSSNTKQLKTVLCESHILIFNPTERQYSSSECSMRESDRPRQQCSRKSQTMKENNQEEYRPQSDSAIYEKPFIHRLLHLSHRLLLQESETDLATASERDHNIVPFHPFAL